MKGELEGKTALVSGGSHGIGLATALSLAAHGCRLVVCSRNEARVTTAVSELNEVSNRDHKGLIFDALDEKSIESLISQVLDVVNDGVDILINNVGGGGRWGQNDPLQTELRVWNEVYQKNVGVATQLTLGLLPRMISKQWGRVVAVTSIYGRVAGGRPWFSVAKHAQEALIKNFSQNRTFARSNITFNSVAPGGIMIPDTGWAEFEKSDPEGYARFLDEELPLGRLGSPDEVASVITFLCSPRASMINGASVLVDGGETSVI
jgi:3-oxoacyl-[acyl-carrier protein] reductase